MINELAAWIVVLAGGCGRAERWLGAEIVDAVIVDAEIADGACVVASSGHEKKKRDRSRTGEA